MPKKRKIRTQKSKPKQIPAWLWIAISIITSISVYFLYKNYQSSLIKYREFGVKIPSKYKIHGIDVSHYQGFINWKSVKQMNIEDVSIQFAFIKATQGIKTLDLNYHQNYIRAKNSGLVVGSYHFFVASKDPLQQASFFYDRAFIRKGDMLPVIDIEKEFGANGSTIRKNLKICLDFLEKKIEKKPIIYTNPGFYHSYLEGYFDEYPLWISHYNNKNQPEINREWQIWQISEKAHINGIEGFVDLNVINNNVESLRSLTVP